MSKIWLACHPMDFVYSKPNYPYVVKLQKIFIDCPHRLPLRSAYLASRDYRFFIDFVSGEACLLFTRELPGVATVYISNGYFFTGKGNTHFKWNIEVAHVHAHFMEDLTQGTCLPARKNMWMWPVPDRKGCDTSRPWWPRENTKVNYSTQQEDRASTKVQTQEEVYICRVQDKKVGLRMPWKSNRHWKLKREGRLLPNGRRFFPQNYFMWNGYSESV